MNVIKTSSQYSFNLLSLHLFFESVCGIIHAIVCGIHTSMLDHPTNSKHAIDST